MSSCWTSRCSLCCDTATAAELTTVADHRFYWSHTFLPTAAVAFHCSVERTNEDRSARLKHPWGQIETNNQSLQSIPCVTTSLQYDPWDEKGKRNYKRMSPWTIYRTLHIIGRGKYGGRILSRTFDHGSKSRSSNRVLRVLAIRLTWWFVVTNHIVSESLRVHL